MRSLNSFLESPIVKVNFAGFESSTYRLQSQGWELSASESLNPYKYGKEIQLMLKYSGIVMVSRLNLIDINRMANSPHEYMDPFDVMGISIDRRSAFMPIRDQVEIDFSARCFSAIDAVPAMKQIDLSTIDLNKFGIFKKLNDSANIFLPEKTVNELMAEILEKQKPMQAEIREKRMKQERLNGLFEIDRRPNEDIKLQLVAI